MNLGVLNWGFQVFVSSSTCMPGFFGDRERKRCVSAGDDLVSTNWGVDIWVSYSLYLLLVLQFARSIHLLKHSSTLSGDPGLNARSVKCLARLMAER